MNCALYLVTNPPHIVMSDLTLTDWNVYSGKRERERIETERKERSVKASSKSHHPWAKSCLLKYLLHRYLRIYKCVLECVNTYTLCYYYVYFFLSFIVTYGTPFINAELQLLLFSSLCGFLFLICFCFV